LILDFGNVPDFIITHCVNLRVVQRQTLLHFSVVVRVLPQPSDWVIVREDVESQGPQAGGSSVVTQLGLQEPQVRLVSSQGPYEVERTFPEASV
jgi:hypothetical protein